MRAATREYPNRYSSCICRRTTVVRGYRITLNSWTHNRYLYAKVDLHDSGTTPVTVYIAVKVSNKAPKAINPDSDRDNVPKSVATVDVCVDRILIVVRTERTGQAVERKAVIGVTDESAFYYVFVVENVVRRDDYLSAGGKQLCVADYGERHLCQYELRQ